MNIHRKKIAILGLGKTGQSLARFLLRQGHVCEGFDENKIALPDNIEMPVHTGKFSAKALAGFDVVAVSPGIRWSLPALVELRNKGVDVTSDLDIFLDHYNGPVIGVTGTNGKTTTTHLIATMIETLPGGIDAGGNVGIPMLGLLRDDRQPARVVLELSSFQLERSNKIKPEWAVLLNVQPDHADMHDSEENYLAAKLRIFANQKRGDSAMLPGDSRWNELAGRIEKQGVRVLRFGHCDDSDPASDGLVAGILEGSNGPAIFWHQNFQRHQIPCDEIPARGEHQHMNMAIAAQAAADYGVSPSVVHETLTSFRGLKHRLEHVGLLAGRDWYDDSKATNPDAAIAALSSFGKTLWICGGLRKDLDLASLIPVAHEHVAQAFVIGRETAPYVEMLKKADVPYEVAGDIGNAVKLAALGKGAEPVLLSPAAASQDQFKNYAERGNAFAAAVRELAGTGGKK